MSDIEKKVPSLEEIELRAYKIYLKRGDGRRRCARRLARCREGTIGIRSDRAIRPDIPVGETCSRFLMFGDARSLDSEAVLEFMFVHHFAHYRK